MAFTGMLCLQIYYGLLLKEHLLRTQEKLECERSFKLCNWSSTQVYLFLLTEEVGTRSVQGGGMHWYIDAEPGAISNLFESLQKFQGSSTF